MTDKELLELAAKAAGIALSRWNDGLEPYSSGEGHILLGNRLWNPLTDDGDALRLAVKLGLTIDHYPEKTKEVIVSEAYGIDALSQEFYFDDPYAATRRAIVRAAAEIGRAL